MFWQITGGANGIGRAIAIELAKCGCNIAIADVDMEGSLDTVEELHLLGVKAFSYEVTIVAFFSLEMQSCLPIIFRLTLPTLRKLLRSKRKSKRILAKSIYS